MIVEDLIRETGAKPSNVSESWPITKLTTLEVAGPDDVSFLASPKWLPQAATSKAGLILAPTALESTVIEALPGRAILFLSNPWQAIKWLLEELVPERSFWFSGIHPTAFVDPSAKLGNNISIGPGAVIGPDTSLGDNTQIGPNAVIGAEVSIGSDSSIHAGAVIQPRCFIGDRVTIHAGSVIGADGFKYEVIAGKRVKIPQVGIVRIDHDVEIGANACIDRASLTETYIGPNTKIDNLVQIGHNVVMGKDCVIVAQVGIAGSTVLKDSVIVGGQAGIADNLTVAEGTFVLARAAVMRDTDPGDKLVGEPARPVREFFRITSALGKLPELPKEIKALRTRIEQLEALLLSNGSDKLEEKP